MKLSIILPTYKVEKYIARCINSCIKQNIPLEEYEILVINDGSPDNSRNIAQGFTQLYKNIRIIDQENGGLSAARNAGLKVAQGEYIWFIDPDDWIEDNCLSQLLNKMDSDKLDALWISWQRVDEFDKPLEQFKDIQKSHDTNVMSGIDFMQNVLLFATFAWSFIFRKEAIKNKYFKEGITFEDIEFIPRTMIDINRIAYINKIVYNYYWRSDSITNIYNPKKINDLSEVILTNLRLSKQYPNISYIKEVVGSLVLSTIRMVSDSAYKAEQKQFLLFLHKNNIKKIIYKGKGLRKLMTIIYNISPKLCILISSNINRK